MTTTNSDIAPAAPAGQAACAERIRYIAPAVSIYEDAEGYTLEAEMPGVSKEGVQITVDNGELVFTGTKAPRPQGARIHGETTRADYRRVFDLDPAVETDRIAARIDQGVLILSLPKAQDKKPRRIHVAD